MPRSVVLLFLCFLSLIAPCASYSQVLNPETEDLLKQGRQALERNAPKEALEHFRAVVKRAPDSAVAHYYRGDAAETLGELDEALDAYRRAARLVRNDQNYQKLSSLLVRMGRRDEGVKELRGHLAWTSTAATAEALFAVLMENGQQEEALTLARERNWVREGADYCGLPISGVSRFTISLLALALHPEKAECLLPLGVSLADNGQLNLARMVLRRIAERGEEKTREQATAIMRTRLPSHEVPAQAEALNVLAFRLANQHKQPDLAIGVYERAIKLDLKFSWPYMNLALVHLQRNSLEEALRWLREAVAVNPNHWLAFRHLGGAARHARRYDEALAAYTRAVQLNPSDAASLAEIGRIAIAFGQRDEGIKALQHALTLNPKLDREREFLNSLANRGEMIDNVLDASGIKRSTVKMAGGLRDAFKLLFGATEKDAAIVNPVMDQVFRGPNLLRLLTAALDADFDFDRLARVLAWLRTPLGAKLTKIEENHADVAPEVIQEYTGKLKGTAEEAERVKLMARLDGAQESTEAQLDLLFAFKRGIGRVINPFLPSDRRASKEDLARERLASKGNLETLTAGRFLYIYRDVSAEEILSYMNFLESPDGRWFTGVTRRGLSDMGEILAETASREIVIRAGKEAVVPKQSL